MKETEPKNDAPLGPEGFRTQSLGMIGLCGDYHDKDAQVKIDMYNDLTRVRNTIVQKNLLPEKDMFDFDKHLYSLHGIIMKNIS